VSDVCVVLCSYRGAAHLAEQLDSIAAQTRAPASVLVHDDASCDATLAIARAHPLGATVRAHPDNVGVVANVERALRDALAEGRDYIALADQDDVWHPERLARGRDRMRQLERRHGAGTPLLVHSDLAMVDAQRRPLAPSFLAWRGYARGEQATLATLLGQSGVMGNTCLCNRALLQLALPFPPELHVHDWWLGVLAELHGARACLEEPLVDYRIHAGNVSNALHRLDGGAGPGSWNRLLHRDFRLPFKEDTRLAAVRSLLDAARPAVPAPARRTIEAFIAYLEFGGSRPRQVRRLLVHGFLRSGWRHRLRVVLAVLTSARYPRGPVRGEPGPTDG